LAENFPIIRPMMEADDLTRVLKLLAAHLHRDFPNDPELVLLGIKTRGVYIAERLAEHLLASHDQTVATGILDITLYRDDLSTLGAQPVVGKTDIDFDVMDKKIILIDDVLYTGRTIRAAMDEIVDFGRPKLIRLLVIVDRGLREYPIQADYIGQKVETSQGEVIQVRLKEADGEDRVLLCALPNGDAS
jgi:pyrimidine operon attenuation protein / uracil phosphoribosyltransferase